MIKVGHRGAAALAPENTLEGCRRAVELGCEMVELDVLPGLELGHDHAGDRLDDALALFAGELTETRLLLDLKRPGYEDDLVAALRRHGLEERALVSSVDPASLRRVRGVPTSISYPDDRHALSMRAWLSPAVRCGLACLRAALPHRIARMVEAAGASTATLHYSVVSPAVLRRCPVPVYAWTVDDAGLARRLESLGVAAIITNDPRIFL